MMLVCERRSHWILMRFKRPKPRPRTRTFPWAGQFPSSFCRAFGSLQANGVPRRFFVRAAGFTPRMRWKQHWTMNKTLLDANTLIAAFDESHADHWRARRFVEGLRGFRTSPQTQGAFLRFFTRPWIDSAGVRQLPRMSTGEAIEHLKAILALPQHAFQPDDISFENVSMRSLSGFKQWNDAYLIALAAKHGLKLATLERKLENMDQPNKPVLEVVP